MIDKLNFEKMNGLIPAIVQDAATRQVLMLGYMNKEALAKTLEERRVTFWSRTKNRLWQKGETSGNAIEVASVKADCDGDAVLVYAHPTGPVCHTGVHTCLAKNRQMRRAPCLAGSRTPSVTDDSINLKVRTRQSFSSKARGALHRKSAKRLLRRWSQLSSRTAKPSKRNQLIFSTI